MSPRSLLVLKAILLHFLVEWTKKIRMPYVCHRSSRRRGWYLRWQIKLEMIPKNPFIVRFDLNLQKMYIDLWLTLKKYNKSKKSQNGARKQDGVVMSHSTFSTISSMFFNGFQWYALIQKAKGYPYQNINVIYEKKKNKKPI